jgi:nicotinamidase-related amidase
MPAEHERTASASTHLALRLRFYRAVPTSAPPGLVEEETSLALQRTAFVELHCWNVGYPGGPAVPEDFWVAMGFRATHELAAQIVGAHIRPALEAARSVGMPVAHVQPEIIAARYPGHRLLTAQSPPPAGIAAPALRGQDTAARRFASAPLPDTGFPDFAQLRAEAVHGAGYRQWAGWQELDIPDPLKPQPGELVAATTEELDGWCRQRGLDTLLYTGFATNLCLLDSPAGMKAMAGLGYRCILLREATLAVEHHDTLSTRLNTRCAVRYVETWVGYTASVTDFVAACQAAQHKGRR